MQGCWLLELEFLYSNAADSSDIGSIVQPEGGFSISYQSEAKLDQTEPVSEKCQEAREDTALITNPRGTLF